MPRRSARPLRFQVLFPTSRGAFNALLFPADVVFYFCNRFSTVGSAAPTRAAFASTRGRNVAPTVKAPARARTRGAPCGSSVRKLWIAVDEMCPARSWSWSCAEGIGGGRGPPPPPFLSARHPPRGGGGRP